MAIYNYFCGECQRTHEVMKNMSEIERKEMCPTCNVVMKRMLCESNFVINGYSESNGYSRKSATRT